METAPLKPLEYRLLDRVRAIRPRTIAAMAAALVVGFLTHMSAMNGLFINADGYLPASGAGWLTAQGKWMFGFWSGLRGCVNLSTVTGPLALLWLVLSAGLTVSILDLRSPILSGLAGAMMVTFPSVVCTFSYPGEDIFFFALLLSCLAVYLIRRTPFGWLTGTIVLTMSVGTYPAYIGYAAGLLLLCCLMELMQKEQPYRAILLRGLSYLAILAVSAGAYYVILQIVLSVNGYVLSGYRGINRLGTFEPSVLWQSLKGAYEKVFRFFLQDAYGMGENVYLPDPIFFSDRLFRWLYRLNVLLSACLFGVSVCRHRLYRSPARLLTVLALWGAFPLAIHAVALLGQNAATHWLMIDSFVLVLLLPLLLLDKLPLPTEDGKPCRPLFLTCARLSAGVLSIALVFNWYIVSTQGYSRLRLGYEGAYTAGTVIVTGVSSMENFSEETPVAIIGCIPDYGAIFRHLDSFTGVEGKNFLYLGTLVEYYIQYYMQFNMTYADVETKDRIRQSPEFAAMPTYPDKGCIGNIDGVITVKLSPEDIS